MFQFILLGAVLISASFAESPTTSTSSSSSSPLAREKVEITFCRHENKKIEIGAKVYKGCEECTCTTKPYISFMGPADQGQVVCSEGTFCCLFIDNEGKTQRAYTGDKYSDGCNTCTCKKDMSVEDCTQQWCKNMCPYYTVDNIVNHTKLGKVIAIDDAVGKKKCPRKCKCTRSGRIKCTGRCLNESPMAIFG
ncbi:uncharacterized protein LOC134815027 [Bolinopsis microptera]|uniref:uncharacterized protein LOC134815027 n=1 Tax=Bolinopsis microptera TaxID=2820187 RepID=UPI00307A8833